MGATQHHLIGKTLVNADGEEFKVIDLGLFHCHPSGEEHLYFTLEFEEGKETEARKDLLLKWIKSGILKVKEEN